MGVMDGEWYARGQPRTAAESDAAATTAANAAVEAALDRITVTPGAEAANAVECACTITTAAGVAVASAREVQIRTLAVTADEGDIAAAGTPVGTLVKAVNPATGENVATMTTTAAGAFSFKVTDTAAEVVHVVVLSDGCIPRVVKLTFT